MPIRTLIIVVVAAALVAGCGRRGALEAPDGPDATLTPGIAETSLAPGSDLPAEELDAAEGGVPLADTQVNEEPVPRKGRFFLDFLL